MRFKHEKDLSPLAFEDGNVMYILSATTTFGNLRWLKFIDFSAANVSIRGYFNNANAPSTRGRIILCIRKMIRHGCQLLSVWPSSCSLHNCWWEGWSSNFSCLVKKDDTFGKTCIWFLINAAFFLFAAPLNDADFFMVAREVAVLREVRVI